MSDVVTVERAGAIAVLRLNRPDALNAVSLELARSLAENLLAADNDADVEAIVLSATGERAFCAGVDLREAREIEVSEVEHWFGTVCNIYRTILQTEKPVVAAINGIAAGAGRAVIFRKGQKARIVPEAEMLTALMEEVDRATAEIEG